MFTKGFLLVCDVFKNEGLCLNTTQILVQNIGHDGSGEHCGKSKIDCDELSDIQPDINHLAFEERKIAIDEIKKYYHTTKPILLKRAINKLKRIILQ